MSRFHHPKPSGTLSARIHGARSTMRERATAAYQAALGAEDERECAMLRGKARAYSEAVEVLTALEKGWNLPRRFRWIRRNR